MKERMKAYLEERRDEYKRLAKEIWDEPELAFEEVKASKWHAQHLEQEGFTISWSENTPTAFIAEFGSGKPIIGILGEYDAIAGMGERDQAGHGCGHNLLGVGALAACEALKDTMVEEGLLGTLRYYGCPGEEMLKGKVLMAQEGAFDDLDACLSWHPGGVTMPQAESMLALCSVEFTFKGKSAHAGVAPHMGRSALDAVELLNIAANYMREHLVETSRIHYIITQGGVQPNSVPERASVWYNLRAVNANILLANYRWLLDIAKGAGQMTQTELEKIDFKSGVHDMQVNKPLLDLMLKNMGELGDMNRSAEEKAEANTLVANMPQDEKRQGMVSSFIPDALKDDILHESFLPYGDFADHQSASTDASDVSKIVPFASSTVATWPIGVVPHTHRALAACGLDMGFSGMIYAAKLLAYSAYDLFTEPSWLEKAKSDFAIFQSETGPYQSIPDQVNQ